MTRIYLKSSTLALLLLLGTCDLFAQNAPKYSNEFLAIGVGARALGMTNSVVASTQDVTAGYWNPAGLTAQEDNLQLSFMHSNYFGGVGNYDYLGISTKLKNNGTLGFSMVRLGIDGIPNTLNLINNGQIDYNQVTEFSAVDYAFLVSYARETSIDGLSLGGNAKIIRRTAGEFSSAWGFGMDIGARYETEGDWMFGLTVRDVTTTFNSWTYSFTEDEQRILEETGNLVPETGLEITLPKFLFGVAKKFSFGEDFSLLAETNLVMNTDGRRNTLVQTDLVSIDPQIGIEANYKQIIYLRTGMNNLQQELSLENQQEWTFMPSIGLGLSLKQITIDYALSNVGNQSAAELSHVFSIRAAINP